MLTPKNNSVAKAFTILRAIALGGRDMTATEVAQTVEMNLATVHRFLLTLESEGVVTRTQSGRFHLGHALAELGGKVEGDVLLIDAVRPHLVALAAEFRETFNSVGRSGNHAIHTSAVLSDRSLNANHPVGEPFPLHCTAAGKVFLANMQADHRSGFIDNADLRRFTASTIVDPAILHGELDKVRMSGYAVDEEEWEEGLRSVAVPLHNNKGKVVAAIAMSAPASRLTDDVISRARHSMQAHVAQVERSLFTESRVFTGKARPRGNFPHLKRVGDFLFLSGTTSRRPDDSFEGVQDINGKLEIDIRKQAAFIFESIADMLETVGASLKDLVEVQAFLRNIDDYAAFNETYARFFDQDGPARTTVGTADLPHPHQGLIVRSIAYRPRAIDVE